LGIVSCDEDEGTTAVVVVVVGDVDGVGDAELVGKVLAVVEVVVVEAEVKPESMNVLTSDKLFFTEICPGKGNEGDGLDLVVVEGLDDDVEVVAEAGNGPIGVKLSPDA